MRRVLSPTGPSAAVVRALNTPADWMFLTRIDSGVGSILGDLHATRHWWAIFAEIDDGAEPVTALGVADQAFLESAPRKDHR